VPEFEAATHPEPDHKILLEQLNLTLPAQLSPRMKIAQLQRQYGLKEIIFVGDRGMITKAVAQKLKEPKVCTPSRH
jgi:hypothetical protein